MPTPTTAPRECLPFAQAGPFSTVEASFVLIEPGVYDLVADAWAADGTPPPGAAYLPAFDCWVVWRAVHRTTRQVTPSLAPVRSRSRSSPA